MYLCAHFDCSTPEHERVVCGQILCVMLRLFHFNTIHFPPLNFFFSTASSFIFQFILTNTTMTSDELVTLVSQTGAGIH